MRTQHTVGWVASLGSHALSDDEIVGFVVFERQDNELRVLKFSVDPAYLSCGVELTLWNALVRYSAVHGRPYVSVPEGFTIPAGSLPLSKPVIVESRDG